MTRAEGGTRDDAGPGGDGEDLVVRLSADPQALREYIARRDAEMRELLRQNGDLERFRGLTLDVVRSLGDAASRAGQPSR